MADNDYEDDIYIIPHNYQENGKILGIIDPKSFFLGMGWLIFISFLTIYAPFSDFFIKMVIVTILGLLPAGIVFVGLGHDSVIDFAKYFINFYKNAKVYHYEK